MDLAALVAQVPEFGARSHPEKIKLFGWYLHSQKNRNRFNQAAIRGCYDELHLVKPDDVSVVFYQLQQKRPPELLRDDRGYYLEGSTQASLEAKFGQIESIVIVDRLLAELPGKISSEAERRFLSESLTCYRHQAYRAAIVMSWNLAYDHLIGWVLADAGRLASFNSSIPSRLGAKRSTGLSVAGREDLEDLKESEVVDICEHAGLISRNLKRILSDKLAKRNMAAHPSMVEITRAQADDTITDLVNNVILKLG